MWTDFYLTAGGLTAGGASCNVLILFIFVLSPDILNSFSHLSVITHFFVPGIAVGLRPESSLLKQKNNPLLVVEKREQKALQREEKTVFSKTKFKSSQARVPRQSVQIQKTLNSIRRPSPASTPQSCSLAGARSPHECRSQRHRRGNQGGCRNRARVRTVPFRCRNHSSTKTPRSRDQGYFNGFKV